MINYYHVINHNMPDVPVWQECIHPRTWQVCKRITEDVYIENSPITFEEALADKESVKSFFDALVKFREITWDND